jgi:hypothetical protein
MKIICPDCDGLGTCGRALYGKLNACERCGGHEDSKGDGYIEVEDIGKIAILQTIIRELVTVAELGFYGTNENAARKAKIVNDPVVKAIVEGK